MTAYHDDENGGDNNNPNLKFVIIASWKHVYEWKCHTFVHSILPYTTQQIYNSLYSQSSIQRHGSNIFPRGIFWGLADAHCRLVITSATHTILFIADLYVGSMGASSF